MSNDLEQTKLQYSSVMEEDEIDLLEVGKTLWKHRRHIISVTLAGTLVAGLISVRMPNIYTATATIMPMDSSSDRLSSSMSALGALGGLASQAGVNLKGSISDKFVALLKSRTVTNNVVSKNQLMPLLFAKQWDSVQAKWKQPSIAMPGQSKANIGPTSHDAYRLLSKNMKPTADPKTGLVTISVDSADPQLAADIANNYVVELNAFLQRNSFSTAKRNRDFLEKQVNDTQHDLTAMESTLKNFQEKNKLVSLDAQTEASVQAYATLKAQLTAKEMELSLQEKSVSPDDVQLMGLKQEVVQLKQKLSAIDTGSSEGLVSFKDAPELGMRFAQLKRDLLVKEQVFELLTQQYEMAKVDESKETLSFQVVDRAIAPDKKSKPRRTLIVLVAAFASFLLSALFILLKGTLGNNLE